MRDVFYTLLVVWIIWRVMDGISTYGSRKGKNTTDASSANSGRKTGQTTVDYIPPTKKRINDDEGEYVDYEEVK